MPADPAVRERRARRHARRADRLGSGRPARGLAASISRAVERRRALDRGRARLPGQRRPAISPPSTPPTGAQLWTLPGADRDRRRAGHLHDRRPAICRGDGGLGRRLGAGAGRARRHVGAGRATSAACSSSGSAAPRNCRPRSPSPAACSIRRPTTARRSRWRAGGALYGRYLRRLPWRRRRSPARWCPICATAPRSKTPTPGATVVIDGALREQGHGLVEQVMNADAGRHHPPIRHPPRQRGQGAGQPGRTAAR